MLKQAICGKKNQNNTFMIFIVPSFIPSVWRLAAWEAMLLKWTIKSHSIAVVITYLEYHSAY